MTDDFETHKSGTFKALDEKDAEIARLRARVVQLKNEIHILTVNLQNTIEIEYGPLEATEQGESDE